ncbi:alcohol dehydrogenase [NADP(+)] isoform X1 [Anoplophora glabripennis]|uniref:alcohol dehydrogenase [NADP(+)] isoform X1 n=1 Tax=Anoplophora glabripennis TaxID=217634 RepID=UPI000C76BCEF|nr:alcohol dehydrogenase [NADP(+)] isoform X1 [Anoplophora glabripennis]
MAAKIFKDLPGGLKMPAIEIGTWQITDEADIETALNTALELGYRHIDTAFAYENEHFIGRVLQEWFSSGKLKREDLFITTKLPLQGVHPDRVEMFIKKSLENLKLDYVDLYLIHFPVGLKYVEGETNPSLVDMQTEPEDHVGVWKKMEEQVDAGRTKTIGLANFNVRQIDRILQSARIKPACLQVELHVYLQQRELVKFCLQNGFVVVAYSPLGCPGYNKSLEEIGAEPKKLPDMLHDETIKKIATKHTKSTAQVMLRYLLQRDLVAIPKSVTPARIKVNIDVFDFSLDAAEVKALDDLEVGEEARVCDFKIIPALLNHPEFPFSK